MVPGPEILQNQSKNSSFIKDVSKMQWFPGTSGTNSEYTTVYDRHKSSFRIGFQPTMIKFVQRSEAIFQKGPFQVLDFIV